MFLGELNEPASSTQNKNGVTDDGHGSSSFNDVELMDQLQDLEYFRLLPTDFSEVLCILHMQRIAAASRPIFSLKFFDYLYTVNNYNYIMSCKI